MLCFFQLFYVFGCGATPPGRTPVPADEMQAIRALAIQVAAQVTLARAIEVVSSSLAVLVNAPVALLSRDSLSWRFETHAFPDPVASGRWPGFDDGDE